MQKTTIDYLLIIIPIIISIISTIISVQNIKLTKQTIFNTNKPHVVPYIETIGGLTFQKTLVIKNFGKTPARITELTFHTKLDEFNEKFKMQSLVDAIIAPNQKFSTVISTDFSNDIKLTLKYKDEFNNITILNETLKTNISEKLIYSTGGHPKDLDETSKAIRESTMTIINNFK